MFSNLRNRLIQNQIKNFQKDVLDNVKYAVNIQSAILPNEKKINTYCPDSFIIYRPQRFVSGDFYWMENINSKVNIVLGDSTGHGVSASYISIIALSALETLKYNKSAIENPKIVLEYLNNHLYGVLKKDKGSSLFESAEMASLTIDFNEHLLTYSSAGITVLTCKKGEIMRLNKNKSSVGAHCKDTFEADKFTHKLTPGERIFIMSDGLKDQHGGEKGKKLGSKKLHELLAETSFLSPMAQKNIIESFLDNWSGSNEQTDDISIIGISVPGKKFLEEI